MVIIVIKRIQFNKLFQRLIIIEINLKVYFNYLKLKILTIVMIKHKIIFFFKF